MANRPEPNKWARLDFPPEFGVGIKQFAVDCGWRLKVVGGATYVATNERYNNVRPQLLRLVKVADAREAGKPELYKRFDSWPRQDAFGSPEISKLVADLREVRDPQDNIDALVSFRLQFMTVPDAHVGDYLSHLFPLIAGTTPDASLWSIEVDPSFRWRVAAVRALFSAREAPEVLERKKTNKALRFSSSQGLAEAWNLGLGVFTEPMLLAGSPWLAGVSSYRIGGSAVILFGRPMAGFSARQAVEGLDLFRTSGLANARVGTTAPENSPLAYETALTWWVNKLNDLVGMALDVGRFSDKNGIYQPAAHLGVLLSLARLFSSVQTILAETRGSEFVRLSLFFDVIDLLEGLSFGSWESLLSRPNVERDFSQLVAGLPERAREYLLTRCQPAIDALRALEDGFVLHERIVDGKLRVRQKDGVGWQDLPLTSAVPQYLRVARNSSHSFRKMATNPHEVSLLAAHDGEIPDALSDLAFLHLLRFLAAPHLPST